MNGISWSCDKDDHYVIFTSPDDITPECPVCSHTMEPHEVMDSKFILEDFIIFAQTEMEAKRRVVSWYNMTQTVHFKPGGEIIVLDHGTLDGHLS